MNAESLLPNWIPVELKSPKLLFLSKFDAAQWYYNYGLDLYEEENYKQALKEFRKGYHKNPEYALLPYMIGLCYQKLEEFDKAKEAFQETLSLTPEDTDALYNLARLYYNENNLEKALSYAELADRLADEPGDDLISCLLGLVYEALGRSEDAIKAYEKSLSLNLDQPDIGLFLGQLYTKQQDYPKTIELYRKLLEVNPNHLALNYEISLCLAKVGDWEETIRYCKKVTELDPAFSKAYNQLGLAYYCTERLQEAVDTYQKALEIDPTYATVHNNMAYTYEKMQQYDKAITKFKDYLSFRMDHVEERIEIEEHIALLQQKLMQ